MNEHAPGWYEHDGERRYWDGDQWTHLTSLPATPESSTPQSSDPPAPPSGSPQPGPDLQAPPPPSGAVAPYTPPPAYGHAPPSYGYAPPSSGYAPPANGPYGAPHSGGVMPPRKEPALSLILSLFFPGVGSMVNGDVGAGVGFLLAYGFGLLLIICLGWALIGLIGLPLCLGVWAWSMYHAYQGAVTHNRAVGYPG